MKIIIGTTSFYPTNVSGVGIFAHFLAVYLLTRGHQVYIITPGRELRDYKSVGRLDHIQLYHLKSIKNPFRSGYYIPFAPGRSVRRILDEIKPDIIHIQDPLPMNEILQKEAHQAKIPVVVTHHFTMAYVLAYIPKIVRPIFWYFLKRKLANFYNQCDAVTTPTQTIATFLKKIGVRKPVFVLSNGVDIAKVSRKVDLSKTRQKFSLPNDQPILLYLGRVDKDKSIDVLVKAMKNVEAHLVIAGSGDLIEKIKEMVKELGLADKVTLTGRIEHQSDDLAGLYQIANIFVIPSTIETQSIVTLEAMANKKPIIAARAGALPEIVKDGKNGYLFEPGNNHQLARLMTNLVKDKKLQERMGQESFTMVERHDLGKCHRAFENLYQKLINREN